MTAWSADVSLGQTAPVTGSSSSSTVIGIAGGGGGGGGGGAVAVQLPLNPGRKQSVEELMAFIDCDHDDKHHNNFDKSCLKSIPKVADKSHYFIDENIVIESLEEECPQIDLHDANRRMAENNHHENLNDSSSALLPVSVVTHPNPDLIILIDTQSSVSFEGNHHVEIQSFRGFDQDSIDESETEHFEIHHESHVEIHLENHVEIYDHIEANDENRQNVETLDGTDNIIVEMIRVETHLENHEESWVGNHVETLNHETRIVETLNQVNTHLENRVEKDDFVKTQQYLETLNQVKIDLEFQVGNQSDSIDFDIDSDDDDGELERFRLRLADSDSVGKPRKNLPPHISQRLLDACCRDIHSSVESIIIDETQTSR
jgi:hypothetical protein